MRLTRHFAMVVLMSTIAWPATAQMKLDAPAATGRASADTFKLSVAAQPAAAPAAPKGPVAPFTYQRPVEPGAAPPPETAAVTTVDESALRYWASQEDVARVSAEIRRLRAIHPEWEPPVDLFAPSRQFEDEKPLWEMYSQSDFAGIRQAIADIQAQRPNWQPSADLAKKIEQGEARMQLVTASEAGEAETVLAIASERNDMLVCGQVDVLWRVAEALAQTGDAERSLQAYRYVLSSCNNPQERLATVQKAGAALGVEAVQQLLPLGRRGPDGRNEFEQVKLDSLRSKIGEVMTSPAAEGPSAQELANFEKTARLTRSAGDAQLLGWKAYNAKDYEKARDWFRTALEWKRDPKSVEGLALSLREMGLIAEAEQMTYDSRTDPLVRKIYIELVSGQITAPGAPPLPQAQLARFAEVVDEAQSPLGAQSMGWAVYGDNNLEGAYNWFKKSVAWGESEEGVIGLIVTSKRLKKEAEYRELTARFGAKYDQVAEVSKALNYRIGGGGGGGGGGKGGGGLSPAAKLAIEQYEKKDYKAAAATLASMRGADRGMKVMQGWAQYNAGDWSGAKETFAKLESQKPSAETTHALRVIKQRQLPPQFRNRR